MANVHEGHSGLRFRGELLDDLTSGDLDSGQTAILEPGQYLRLFLDELDLGAGDDGLLGSWAGDLAFKGLEAVVEDLRNGALL